MQEMWLAVDKHDYLLTIDSIKLRISWSSIAGRGGGYDHVLQALQGGFAIMPLPPTSIDDSLLFLARYVIYTSRAYATMSVSRVRLSVCLWRKCIGAL